MVIISKIIKRLQLRKIHKEKEEIPLSDTKLPECIPLYVCVNGCAFLTTK